MGVLLCLLCFVSLVMEGSSCCILLPSLLGVVCFVTLILTCQFVDSLLQPSTIIFKSILQNPGVLVSEYFSCFYCRVIKGYYMLQIMDGYIGTIKVLQMILAVV